MSSIYTPYTYLIGWSEHQKFYYGVRYAKKANPSELWVSYFTSSPIVKRFVKEHGQPDIVQVRKVFTDRITAITWEQKVLRKVNIKNNEKWLNGNLAGAIFKNLDHMRGKQGHMAGKTHSDEAKEKMRQAKLGKSSWNKGVKLSDNHKEKLSKAKENYVPWNAGKQGLQKHSDETKEKIRLSKLKTNKEITLHECLCCGETKAKNKFCSNSCRAKYYAQQRSSLGLNGFQNKANQDAAQAVRRPVGLYGGAHTADFRSSC